MKVYITKKAKSSYRTDSYSEFGQYLKLYILYEYEKVFGRDKTWSNKKPKSHNEIYLKTKSIPFLLDIDGGLIKKQLD